MAKSVDFSVFSILVTGSDRGIGLGLVKRFLELPSPPEWVFATTLDLEGEETKTLLILKASKRLGKKWNSILEKAFLPLLKKAAQRSPCQVLSSSKAAIINMSSIGGSIERIGYWDQAKVIGYRCSKAALNMLTKCQSLEYSADGIMSVAIHPGLVKTSQKITMGISVEESTQGIVTVMSKLCEEDNGTFLDWLGRPIPW
ncbi:C-signal-like [Ahaetulla prasina]|uniref:C-signal-like n=1 Tax=Ahaetulla prasina TaxID=499056 RepID=UPI002649B128|nr:C-signal-like [Ahaetulla prasina]